MTGRTSCQLVTVIVAPNSRRRTSTSWTKVDRGSSFVILLVVWLHCRLDYKSAPEPLN